MLTLSVNPSAATDLSARLDILKPAQAQQKHAIFFFPLQEGAADAYV